MVEHIANVKEDSPPPILAFPLWVGSAALRHGPSPRLDAATRAWLAGLAQTQWRRMEQGRPAPPSPAPPLLLVPAALREREGRLISSGV